MAILRYQLSTTINGNDYIITEGNGYILLQLRPSPDMECGPIEIGRYKTIESAKIILSYIAGELST